MLVLPWQLFYAVWRKLLGFVGRWTDPPIMHRRINDGSDKYFAWREKHEGDSAVDEFVDEDDFS
jgi:hypothetical protein